MTRFCCVLLAVAMGLHMNAQSNETIICTEVCVANIDQTIDYSNNYGGWIELFNPTATEVLLNGWYISDDAEMLTKHKLSGHREAPRLAGHRLVPQHHASDAFHNPQRNHFQSRHLRILLRKL